MKRIVHVILVLLFLVILIGAALDFSINYPNPPKFDLAFIFNGTLNNFYIAFVGFWIAFLGVRWIYFIIPARIRFHLARFYCFIFIFYPTGFTVNKKDYINDVPLETRLLKLCVGIVMLAFGSYLFMKFKT